MQVAIGIGRAVMQRVLLARVVLRQALIHLAVGPPALDLRLPHHRVGAQVEAGGGQAHGGGVGAWGGGGVRGEGRMWRGCEMVWCSQQPPCL